MTKLIKDVNLKKEDSLGNQIMQDCSNTENSSVLSTKANSLERKSTLSHGTRFVRKKLPPPPPPPIEFSDTSDIKEPVSPEVKRKMQAVIRELNKCRRVEPDEFYDILKSPAMVPKLVIPVIAADSVYFSDDNKFSGSRKNDADSENNEQFDSLERKIPKKRRFSLDYAAQSNKKEMLSLQNTSITRDRRTRSWRDLKNNQTENGVAQQAITFNCDSRKKYNTNNIFINSVQPIYNNVENPGPLTIEVRGSPVSNRQKIKDDFDPDTLDRKPKKSIEDMDTKKCVDKILLKSGGSFKYKLVVPETQHKINPTEEAFTRKIGSLRQIYEARTKAQNDVRFYERRGSVPYGTQELAAYVKNLEQPRNLENQFGPKPPMPPKQKRCPELYTKGNTPRNSPPSDRYRSSEERDRFPPHSRSDDRRSDLNARRSGRRSARTRPRRVDIRKLCRTEDSGYLSTDSNESKRRARYLMQLKPKLPLPEPVLKMPVSKVNNLHIDTDTDDLESLCDGRSESGGESVETDSVFFGNFKDSKHIFEELGYGPRNKLGRNQEQEDSGFAGETNIILSGDSDSEHKSVISIVTGRDGRASAASISNRDDSPYIQSVEC
ncbi:jg18415 [Pararge aegeria aegeria]|uniref:Jg18415 protein n=2 Tax=Pararge aegeria TaxID=116150 RepID=A0A8S4SF27_9NEOP|nr:jg18415 [Pararge aegeria aegeria]